MDTAVGLKLPVTPNLPHYTLEKSAAEWGQLAESIGYESIWSNEGWGAEVFVNVSSIATITDELLVGTAIANVYSRTPAVLAMAATTLAKNSGGRFILGLGASHPKRVEGLHGVPYDRPVRRSHETIELLKSFMGSGIESVDFDGETISAHSFPPLDESVPVYNAALGPANRRMTGRVADGWIPHLIPFSYLKTAFETIETAARDAGRNPDEISVSPQVLTIVDPDRDEAAEPIRKFVASYIGKYDGYKNAIGTVYPDETDAIADAWRSGNETDASRAVTDEMVADFGIAGSAAEARSQLRTLLDRDIIDRAIVYVPRSVEYSRLVATITALAPDRL